MEKSEIKALALAIVEEMDKIHSAEFAPKWEGASIFFIPKDNTNKDHEMPIDILMHKVVLIRNNLRVLEQQINASDSLSEDRKSVV